jgi:hypothetical protein
MSDWPDDKIRSTALGYINKHSMDPASWRFTSVGDAYPEALARAGLVAGEAPLASFFLSDENWYLFSTRRILGSYSGQRVAVAVLDVLENRFGGDFKGRDGAQVEIMTLRLASGLEARLQYETGRPSMAPIYYFRYWKIKYPILNRLRA